MAPTHSAVYVLKARGAVLVTCRAKPLRNSVPVLSRTGRSQAFNVLWAQASHDVPTNGYRPTFFRSLVESARSGKSLNCVPNSAPPWQAGAMTAPHPPLATAPSADFVPNSWPNSGFRNSRRRGTRGG